MSTKPKRPNTKALAVHVTPEVHALVIEAVTTDALGKGELPSITRWGASVLEREARKVLAKKVEKRA